MAWVAAFPLSTSVYLPFGIPSCSPPPPFSPQESPLPFEVKDRIFMRWICGNDDDGAGSSGPADQWSILIELLVLESAISGLRPQPGVAVAGVAAWGARFPHGGEAAAQGI